MSELKAVVSEAAERLVKNHADRYGWSEEKMTGPPELFAVFWLEELGRVETFRVAIPAEAWAGWDVPTVIRTTAEVLGERRPDHLNLEILAGIVFVTECWVAMAPHGSAAADQINAHLADRALEEYPGRQNVRIATALTREFDFGTGILLESGEIDETPGVAVGDADPHGALSGAMHHLMRVLRGEA